MKIRNMLLSILGGLVRYAPFLALLAIQCMSLYRNLTAVPVDSVQVWTSVLLTVITLAMTGNRYTQSAASVIMIGEKPDMIRDLSRMDGQDVAIAYNWIFAAPLMIGVPVLLMFLFIKTEMKGFLYAATIYAIAHLIGTGIKLLAFYIQTRELGNSNLSKLLNPIALPNIIGLVLILLTNEKTVGFVYRNLQFPESTTMLIISLILILIYLLTILFCFFAFSMSRWPSFF